MFAIDLLALIVRFLIEAREVGDTIGTILWQNESDILCIKILDRDGLDSCISTCQIVLDVLVHRGIDPRSIPIAPTNWDPEECDMVTYMLDICPEGLLINKHRNHIYVHYDATYRSIINI